MSTIDFSSSNKEISLLGRKDNYESKKQAELDKIKEAVGHEYTVEVQGVHPKEWNKTVYEVKCPSADWMQDKPGQIIFGYLQQVAEFLQKGAKDDMVKEEFVDSTPNRKIVFRAFAKGDDDKSPNKLGYKEFNLLIDGGNLEVHIFLNASHDYRVYIGRESKLEKLL